jgi:hypothetical protein
MFEDRNLAGRAVQGGPGQAGEGGAPLRPLLWSELVARFAAARDLRHAVTLSHGAAPGSFDGGAARWLNDLGKGKPAVNPDALGNGKPGKGMAGRDGNNARIGDRGTE